jgi:short-subunit dehydrogenase
MDLGNMDSLKSRIEQILGDFGRIDILINNAGMKSFKPFEEYAFDDIEKITKVNFISHALICKIVLPIMKKNAYGRIINISSSAAYYGYKNGAIYCSTKSALKIFTEALSQELVNFNVTINAICPQTIAIPEYLKENPSCKRGNLIKPETITRRILRLIDSGANGEVVPIISFTNKIRYFYYDIKKIYKWLF